MISISDLLSAANKIFDQFNTMLDNDENLKELKEDLLLIQTTLQQLDKDIQKRPEFDEASKAFNDSLVKIEKALKEMNTQGVNAYLKAGDNKKDLESHQACLTSRLRLWELALNLAQANIGKERQEQLLSEIANLEKQINDLSFKDAIQRNEHFMSFSNRFDLLEEKISDLSKIAKEQADKPNLDVYVTGQSASYADQVDTEMIFPEGIDEETRKFMKEMYLAAASKASSGASSNSVQGKVRVTLSGTGATAAKYVPLRMIALQRRKDIQNSDTSNAMTNSPSSSAAAGGTAVDLKKMSNN